MTLIARRPFPMRVALARGASLLGIASLDDTGLNRTMSPGASRAGRVRLVSKTFTAVRPMSCLAWVNPRLSASDTDGPCRNSHARRGAAGSGNRRVDRAEIAKAWQKPQHEDAIVGAGVSLDHSVSTQSSPLGDFREIRPGFPPVRDRNLNCLSLRDWLLLIAQLHERGAQRVWLDRQRIEEHRNRSIG